MDDRQIQVSAAHTKTFRWIFEPSSVDGGLWFNFPKWLQDVHDPLYWVTGKPGSGKSTLMKFIQTFRGDANINYGSLIEAMLPRQDGEPPWTIANYYAWYADQELQRSIGGLCHNFIYQLAKCHPSTLPILFPTCWEALWLVDDLGPQQLAIVKGLRGDERKTLLDMVREVTKTHRIFFLIDGLDEINDETEEAAELVLELASLPNVKVCASSRPWPVFEDAFGRKPHLTIHDLTKTDIVTYVRDNLSRGDGFSRLQKRDPSYASRLIDQVADKSAGVFL
jgi:adenylate kinase family enzyme